MAEKYVSGHERTLARYDGTAYKPLVCLTSAAFQAVMNMIEKVNMCTNGKTQQSPNSITRTIQIEGEVVDTTVVGGASISESIEELYKVQETQLSTKKPDTWRLSNGPFGYKYFDGFLTDLSDNYQAGEDATFSATLSVENTPSDTDPKAKA